MILEAKPKHLNNIASIHQAVLGNTLTSRIGKTFIVSLYKLLLANKTWGKIFIMENAGGVEGFISLTSDRLEMNVLINRSLNFAEKIHLALFIMLHPGSILQLYNKARLDQYINANYAIYPSILTLGISPDNQGKGLGRNLILRAEKYFKERGISKYFVDTEAENKNAVQFYRKLGFNRVDTVSGNIILEKII